MLLSRFAAAAAFGLLAASAADTSDAQASGLVNEIIDKLESALSCGACHALLGPIQLLAALGDKTFSKSFAGICKLAGAQDDDVCDGIMATQGPILAHAIRRINTLGSTATKLCNAVFGLCQPPNVNAFNVSFPKPAPTTPPAKPPSSGRPPLRVVHMSDVHIDREYTVGSEGNCTKPICCRNFADQANSTIEVPAGPFGNVLCDSPIKLGDVMLQTIRELDPAFAIFTGDVIDHSIWLIDEPIAADGLTQFNNQMASFLGDLTVYPALGNHDTAPANSFPLSDSATRAKNNSDSSNQWVFDIQAAGWARWIQTAAAQQFIHSSGSYSVLVPGTKLRVISLNTQYYYRQNYWLYDRNTMVRDPQGMLAFVVSQLQLAEDQGERAWIIGHVSSGVSDFLHDQSNYFNQIVNRYKATIAGQFFGHTHVDQFEIAYSNFKAQTAEHAIAVNILAPSLAPTSGNPAFKVYDIDPDTYELLDARVFIANISSPSYQTLPKFEQYYSARDSYGPLVSPPLGRTQPLSPAFWHNLTVAFENNDAAFQLYNERLSRSGLVRSCTGDCKTTTICGLRAARSENNCDVAHASFPSKRADEEDIVLDGLEHGHDCEGVTVGSILRQSHRELVQAARRRARSV
ncbi:putative acid sphingomyelinase [Auricularia subglabra TFB-10046 SS5]|nr:putative acid sphingomyelinase [Auricularia subglabra TFB-10046 SS5]